ncbi:hypothetical protein RCL_jg4118.t1 [Rhizophagus clarus]|uniref:Uncharacterized protein n=1 Tax=Rhizophagus clarus TaxID=94130 RepID=A0A8H3M1H2_9GLOM|nr:hypothetical protein RCL_jg4118.t1 [Rhizophagus clarus]
MTVKSTWMECLKFSALTSVSHEMNSYKDAARGISKVRACLQGNYHDIFLRAAMKLFSKQDLNHSLTSENIVAKEIFVYQSDCKNNHH